MQEGIGSTNAARVVDESTGCGACLRLDDLVEEGVDRGCGDVSGVSAVRAKLGDEVAVVLLLDDGWYTRDVVARCEAGTEHVG